MADLDGLYDHADRLRAAVARFTPDDKPEEVQKPSPDEPEE